MLPTEDSCDGGDEKVSNDLPTEESLLVKFSSGADVALVKGLLVIIILKMGGLKLSKVSMKLVI